MIEIQPIERVDMAHRIDQVRRRIAAIEEKIGLNGGDFQATLERAIARQANIQPTQPTQPTQEAQNIPGANQPAPINPAPQTPAPNTPTPSAPPQSRLPGEEALPGGNRPQQPQQPPQIDRREIPDVEPQTPSRDEKIFSNPYDGNDAEVTPTEDLIMQTAYEYGVDPRLVRAIAIAESDMNQDEISPVGAIGVMQLMPETAASLGVNPYDEGENIQGGTMYIRQMLDTFDGNVPLAVAAYNAGPNAVRRYGGIPPYRETQNYVGRVMDMYQ